MTCKIFNIGVIMTKKLMFVLLMSGFILSPIGAYAMDEEGAPQTSISRPTPSASQLTQEEKRPELSAHIKEKLKERAQDMERWHEVMPLNSYLNANEMKQYETYLEHTRVR